MRAANPDAARQISAQLVTPGHSRFVARMARLMLADFDVLAGSIGAGRRRPLAPGADADWRLESEALLAAEPALGLPQAYIAEVRDRLAARRTFQAVMWAAADRSPQAGSLVRLHLLVRLSRRLGDEEGAQRYAELRRAAVTGTTKALEPVLEATEYADRARTAGRWAEVLAELDRFRFATSAGSPARTREGARFMFAEALVALGRDTEALPWYESFVGPFDTPFLAIAALREAQIHERAGRRVRAAECYRRTLRLWRDASAAFAPLTGAARAGLARVE